jgi:hypothetical protein
MRQPDRAGPVGRPLDPLVPGLPALTGLKLTGLQSLTGLG